MKNSYKQRFKISGIFLSQSTGLFIIQWNKYFKIAQIILNGKIR